jgi:regulatory protein
LRIREELAQRGLPREAITQALAEAEIDWAAQLREVWRRRFAEQLPVDARTRAQQGRFLSYRGYPVDLIGRLLRNADQD